MPKKIIMRSARTNLGWFLLGLCSHNALADQTEIEYRKVLAPTMAVFYAIDSEGRSVRETPSVLAISSPNANASRSVMTDRPRLKQEAYQQTRSHRVISIRVPRTTYDSSEAFRCERYGFYYTSDGRCVVPRFRRIRNP